MRARFLSACSLSILLCCSSSLLADSPESTSTVKAENGALRTAEELREAIRAAMKRTNSMAERSVADRLDEPAVLELIELYRALGADTQLPVTERESLLGQIRIRLQRIGKTIDRRLQRTAKASAAKATTVKASTIKTSTAKTSTIKTSAVATVAAQTSVVEGTPVAPAQGGGPVDHGQELLNLIKATIAPDSWDDQGGKGTIFYWPAWHVLVIRQTDEVHEQIEGLLKALR